jgi:hypothetical protein
MTDLATNVLYYGDNLDILPHHQDTWRTYRHLSHAWPGG